MKGAPARLPTWSELALLPDGDIDVELGTALVARDTYDALDVHALLGELAALGAPLATVTTDPVRDRVEAVSELFTSLGFRGNTDDYSDPKNSLLPDVLTRRTGIPITLAIVWCALAKRAGLVARGVAFPGHFLVRVEAQEPIIVDAFDGGCVVDNIQAAMLLRRALGQSAALHRSLFAAASPRTVLVRVLTNLQSAYGKRGEHARAFVAVDRILTLLPDSARMLRERAAFALRLGANEVARSDLARVIELEPQAPDIPQLTARLAKLTATTTTTKALSN